MKLRKATLLAAGSALALGVSAGAASADEETLTIVSWGGAYTMSQQKAYHEPYMERNPDVNIVNEDKAANGLAGIRAQVQAGNVTWDIVDVVAADAMRLCDEGLAQEIDHDELLKPAPDGTPAEVSFQRVSANEVLLLLDGRSYPFTAETQDDGPPGRPTDAAERSHR